MVTEGCKVVTWPNGKHTLFSDKVFAIQNSELEKGGRMGKLDDR